MLLWYWLVIFLLVALAGLTLLGPAPAERAVANLKSLARRSGSAPQMEEPRPLRARPRLFRLERTLGAAGSGLRSREFLGLVGIGVLVAALLGYRLGGGAGLLLAGALAGWLPYWNLGRLRRQRQALLEKALPETLGSIANGLRAGYSFLQALDAVTHEVQGPLSQEVSRVVTDLRVGRSSEEALNAWAERSASADIDLLVTSLLIQRQVGGNLAGLLTKLQSTIRDRQRRRGDVKALTAQGRLSGWIVGVLPVALLGAMSVMDPNLTGPLFHTSPGHLILILAAGSESLGILSIRKLLQVEV